MAWNCICSGDSHYDFPAYLWPVAESECAGKAQECQMICSKDTVHPATCAATCNSYYQCGTERAPPSYLQTENPEDEPSYDGPKRQVVPNVTVSNTTTAGHDGAAASGGVIAADLIKHHAVLVPLVVVMVVVL